MKWEGRSAGDVITYLASRDRLEEAHRWAGAFARFRVPPLPHWMTGGGKGIGSSNFRPSLELGYGKMSAADFFDALARVWLAQGIWGRELGAMYTAGQLPAWVLAYQWALDTGRNHAMIGTVLRATWALLAFQSMPNSIEQRALFRGKGVGWEEGHADYYVGPETLTVGDRHNEATAALPELGVALAFVVDWPGRIFRRFVRDPDIPDGPPYTGRDGREMVSVGGREMPAGAFRLQQVPLASLVSAGGVSDYRDRAAAERFALFENERALLRQVIEGDTTAATLVYDAMLAGVRVYEGYGKLVIERSDDELLAFIWSGGTQGNKPPVPAAKLSANGREYRALYPSQFKGVGATRPRMTITDETVTAAADGNEVTLVRPMPHRWRIEISADGARVTAGPLAQFVDGGGWEPPGDDDPAPIEPPGDDDGSGSDRRKWIIAAVVILGIAAAVFFL